MNKTAIYIDQASLRKFNDALKTLPAKLYKSEMNKILRRQAKPVEKAMKQLAPVRKDKYIVNSKSGKKVIRRDYQQRRYKSRKGGPVGRGRGVRDGEGRITGIDYKGNLQKSIRITNSKSKTRAGIIVGPLQGGKYDAWYRHFVIGGTRHGIKPRPFVRWAASRASQSAGDAMSDELQKYLKYKARKLGLEIR